MEKFDKLVEIVNILRGPNGCEWDKTLTLKTVKTYLLEEAYELYDAIIKEDHNEIKEELGDLLLEIVLIAQMEKELGNFNIENSIDKINEKMLRRHPHVFGDIKTKDVNEILINWEKIKGNEKKKAKKSYLDGIPNSLPSMMKAFKIQERVARVGFEWKNINGIIDKLEEEFAELQNELSMIGEDNFKQNIVRDEQLRQRIEDEIGDVFFVMINLSRRLSLDPEEILSKTVDKFKRRFSYIEDKLKEANKSLQESNLEEMDKYWNESKAKGL